MEYQGTDLYEKTVGVIGWGRIGRGVAEILIAFGCNVIGYDPAWPNLSTLDELLRTADVITIHANLNESSRGMIGHAEFGKMKDGVMISNTARGKIIDEAAMLAALKSGKVAAAFLDVTRDEPLSPDSELVRYRRENPRRLKLTPHIAGNSKESLAKAEMLLAKRLVRELESLDSAQRCEAGHSLTGRTKPQTGHVSKS